MYSKLSIFRHLLKPLGTTLYPRQLFHIHHPSFFKLTSNTLRQSSNLCIKNRSFLSINCHDGMVFNIEDLATKDGAGIRSVIFMKGCPLTCIWCSNPESQKSHVEIMHFPHLCKTCGRCQEVCRNNAITFDHNNFPYFNRKVCVDCNTKVCLNHCLNDAIKIVGQKWNPKTLFYKICQNLSFFRNSNGGVTFSGGEPLLQPKFVSNFLFECEKIGLSVGVETCGYFNWNAVKDFVDKFDFIFFDIKSVDDQLHKTVTSVSNRIILENLRRLSEHINPERIIISLPIVPNVNDNKEHLDKVIQICHDLNITNVRLLPYHSLGSDKYRSLGRAYKMQKDLHIGEKIIPEFQSYLEKNNLNCLSC